jgi:7-carboxy-7-deazaguanine synthase
MKGKISEIFESIQGEGIYAGEKQIFVRFFGCNLNCRFCDTKPYHFVEYEPKELLSRIKRYRGAYHSVVFTGGEPLMQKDFLREIMKLTRKSGFKNYLETNGTLPQALEEVIDYSDILAMDLKLPSSTNQESYWDEHRRFLGVASGKEAFLKIVICATTREEDLRRAISLLKDSYPAAILVLQPNSYEEAGSLLEKLEQFRNICIDEHITVCVIPQIHKIVGVK